jgi:hypothetical protein
MMNNRRFRYTAPPTIQDGVPTGPGIENSTDILQQTLFLSNEMVGV